MVKQPTEPAPTLFHVEKQEVYYRTYVIDAANKDLARKLVDEKKQGEVVGDALVDRRVTNVHPVTDACVERGCYRRPSEEEAGEWVSGVRGGATPHCLHRPPS